MDNRDIPREIRLACILPSRSKVQAILRKKKKRKKRSKPNRNNTTTNNVRLFLNQRVPSRKNPFTLFLLFMTKTNCEYLKIKMKKQVFENFLKYIKYKPPSSSFIIVTYTIPTCISDRPLKGETPLL